MLLIMVVFTMLGKIGSFNRNSFLNKAVKLYSTTDITGISMSEYKKLVLLQEKNENYENKIKGVVKGILANETGACLFSTISNKTTILKEESPEYPVSFLLNYYLDFDGKPFFKLNGNYPSYQSKLIRESPPTSMNIYSIGYENSYLIENLIIYGKTYEVSNSSEIERLEWISESFENIDVLKEDHKYSYFKMKNVDQIELVTTESKQTNDLEHFVFNFKKPETCLKDFRVESSNILDYIKMFYSREIHENVIKNYGYDYINFLTIEDIDELGINIIVNHNSNINLKNEKRFIDENVKINFSKRIKNFHELYEELKTLS